MPQNNTTLRETMLIQNMTRTKTCQWCGRTFRVPKTREHNATKYCCIRCSYYSYLEKHNIAQHEYLKRYEDFVKNRRYGSIGLGATPEADFEEELKKIRKELRMRGLRK